MGLDVAYKIDFPVKNTPSGEMFHRFFLNAAPGIPQPITFEVSADELGLIISKTGELTQHWDDRDFFFGYGELTLELQDTQNAIQNILLGPDYYPEGSYIEFWLKRPGKDWEVEFRGTPSIQEPYISVTKRNTIEIRFGPSTEKLGEAPTNVDGNFNDLFDGKYNINGNESYNYAEVLTDFFKIIHPEIEVSLHNPWTFITALPEAHQFAFQDLLVRFQLLFKKEIAPNNFAWIQSTYMQTLKEALLSLGMFGGVLSENKAFAIPFADHLHTSQQIMLNNHNLSDHVKIRERHQIKYVELQGYPDVNYASAGFKTGIGEKDLYIRNHGPIFRTIIPGGQIRPMARISRDSGATSLDWSDYFIQLFSPYYLTHRNERRDKMIFNGTDYNIYNTFNLNNTVYIPLELRKNYKTSQTTAYCLPIGTSSIIEPMEAAPGWGQRGLFSSDYVKLLTWTGELFSKQE